MKYSEFKREVEKMGFVVIDSGAPIYVDKDKDGETLMSIDVHRRFRLDPGWSGFNKLTEDQQLKVYDLAYQLAKTPPAEREEDKLYNVIFPTIQRDGNFIYMAKDNSNGDPLGIDWSDYIYMKRNPTNFAFTEQEIKDIDERYLAFKVEVKDE